MFSLGEKLVNELGLEGGTDTLARWVAHYIAELILAAEQATEESGEARQRCATAILELWSHRAALPSGKRPFEELEAAFDTLRAIDPSRDHLFYHPNRWRRDRNNQDEGVVQDMEIVQGIDYTARLLIEYLLEQSLGPAIEKAESWVAEVSGSEGLLGADAVFAIELKSSVDGWRHRRRHDKQALLERIDRLDRFVGAATDLRRLIEQEMREVEPSPGSGTTHTRPGPR